MKPFLAYRKDDPNFPEVNAALLLELPKRKDFFLHNNGHKSKTHLIEFHMRGSLLLWDFKEGMEERDLIYRALKNRLIELVKE